MQIEVAGLVEGEPLRAGPRWPGLGCDNTVLEVSRRSGTCGDVRLPWVRSVGRRAIYNTQVL